VEIDARQCPKCGSLALVFANAKGIETEAPVADVTPMEAAAAEAPAFLDTVREWMTQKWFWPAVAGGVLLLSLGAWWAFGAGHKSATVAQSRLNSNAVEPENRLQLEALLQEAIAEKLEWGQALLKQRMPSRFPEELRLDVNKAQIDVQYTNREKTAVTYSIPVAYHFPELPVNAYTWELGTFFFEKQQGKWVLIGDKWLNEWDIHFE